MKTIYESGIYSVVYIGISGSGIASPGMVKSYLHKYQLLKNGQAIKFYNTSSQVGKIFNAEVEDEKAINELKQFML